RGVLIPPVYPTNPAPTKPALGQLDGAVQSPYLWSPLETAARVKRNTVPPPRLGSPFRRPPCASTIERQIERPSPIPLAFVETNGSKSRLATSFPSPRPLPATAISKVSPSRNVL